MGNACLTSFESKETFQQSTIDLLSAVGFGGGGGGGSDDGPSPTTASGANGTSGWFGSTRQQVDRPKSSESTDRNAI